jgi:nucleotide-binding universal stress UspA family protein
MSLRDVLVFLDKLAPSQERLRLAVRLAEQHRACLSAVFLEEDYIRELPSGLSIPRIALMAGTAVPIAAEPSHGAIYTEAASQAFRRRLCSSKAVGEWYSLNQPNMAELVRLARTADLVIMGQINPHIRGEAKYRPEQIIAACGRPVLMVPYIGSFDHVGRRVMVAWDGSREAARAVNDALPVIDTADTVTVLTVRHHPKSAGERLQAEKDRIVKHLAHHGVAARVEETLRCRNTVYDVLLSRVADHSIDLMVAGATLHSRLRDALIGSVSRGLFRHMTVPVMMSH